MKQITKNIYNIGVIDEKITLFEGQYHVTNGMTYNSYLIKDNEIVILDTVDQNFVDEWLHNIEEVLDKEEPHYLVISHMEPDHSAGIEKIIQKYPHITIVGNQKTIQMINQFFPNLKVNNPFIVKDSQSLCTGTHTLNFVMAPMVHWPEVMVTYESFEKILFSADAFGTFGNPKELSDYVDEARRYYIGIVGKFGISVGALLKKASTLEINKILPLHGPVLSDNISYYFDLYQKWSKYENEEKGVLICYSSVYGHTKDAALALSKELSANHIENKVMNLATDDLALAVSYAFKYDKLVLASITYNGGLFPHMMHFLLGLIERNYQKRTIGIIENGTWSSTAYKNIKEMLAPLKEINFIEPIISIKSKMTEDDEKQIKELAKNLKEV